MRSRLGASGLPCVDDAEGCDVFVTNALGGDYGVGSGRSGVAHGREVATAQEHVVADGDAERVHELEPGPKREQRRFVAVTMTHFLLGCLNRHAVSTQDVQVRRHDQIAGPGGNHDGVRRCPDALPDHMLDSWHVPNGQHLIRDDGAEQPEPRGVSGCGYHRGPVELSFSSPGGLALAGPGGT